MDHALRIIDRGVIFDAARHALSLHQWLIVPDFDQEGEVKKARSRPRDARSPCQSVAIGLARRARMARSLTAHDHRDPDGSVPILDPARSLARTCSTDPEPPRSAPRLPGRSMPADSRYSWPRSRDRSRRRGDSCCWTWNVPGWARAARWREGEAIHAPLSRSTCSRRHR